MTLSELLITLSILESAVSALSLRGLARENDCVVFYNDWFLWTAAALSRRLFKSHYHDSLEMKGLAPHSWW